MKIGIYGKTGRLVGKIILAGGSAHLPRFRVFVKIKQKYLWAILIADGLSPQLKISFNRARRGWSYRTAMRNMKCRR